jgi:hypothetical protein
MISRYESFRINTIIKTYQDNHRGKVIMDFPVISNDINANIYKWLLDETRVRIKLYAVVDIMWEISLPFGGYYEVTKSFAHADHHIQDHFDNDEDTDLYDVSDLKSCLCEQYHKANFRIVDLWLIYHEDEYPDEEYPDEEELDWDRVLMKQIYANKEKGEFGLGLLTLDT